MAEEFFPNGHRVSLNMARSCMSFGKLVFTNFIPRITKDTKDNNGVN